MKRLFVFVAILYSASICSAKIKISAITGASNVTGINTAIDTPTIRVFGGTGGGSTANGCSSLNNTSTCDSCGNDFSICNKTRIYDTLNLSITFASTDATAGVPIATYSSSTSGSQLPLGNPGPILIGGTPNQTRTISITWSQICSYIPNGTTSCDTTSGSLSISIGIDKNSDSKLDSTSDDVATITVVVRSPSATDMASFTPKMTASGANCTAGFCNFALYPGDEKAYISNYTLKPPNGTTITKVHFGCGSSPEVNSFTDINRQHFTFYVNVNGGSSLVEDIITGLTNDTTYYCRTALEDEAGNIGLFSDDTGGNGLNDGDGDTPPPPDLSQTLDKCPDGTYDGSCHKVTPSAVIGLFDKKCFIATAAYGSHLHPFVKTLQMFRGKYLMPYSWGRSFVRWYYKTGPQWAEWISKSDIRLYGARILLLPIILFACSILYWPWTLLLMSCLYFFYSKRQRRIAA